MSESGAWSVVTQVGRYRQTERSETELRSCVKDEVAVLGSPSLMVLMVSVDVKQHELAEYLRNCVKVEEGVLGSPSQTVLMVSVDVKQH